MCVVFKPLLLYYHIIIILIFCHFRRNYEVDPGKSGLRLGQAVRAEGSASDVRVIAVRLVYM